MFALSRCNAATVLVLLLTTLVNAQSVFFTNYPTQVVGGQFYPVSWSSAGTAITVNLVRAGIVEETLFTSSDGSVTSFTWDVDDDDDGGADYALQLMPAGGGGAPVNSGPIWIIDNEEGLLVNGQLIFASVSNGPTQSGLAPTSATASTVMSVANAATSQSQTASTIASSANAATSQSGALQTVAFTTAGSSYTFVTVAPTTSVTAETLTFVSNGLSFTTTINLSLPTESTSSTTHTSNSSNGGGLGAGAIAGIVVGVVVLVLLVVGFLWFRRRRQHHRRGQGGLIASSTKMSPSDSGGLLGEEKSTAIAEKSNGDVEKTAEPNKVMSPLSSEHHEMEAPIQMRSPAKTTASAELDGLNRHEMNAAPPRYELAAESVPVEMGSNVRDSVMLNSVSRAGTVSHSGVVSNGSVSAASNV